MKLHQVIMAILMFKTLDWLVVAFARDPYSSLFGSIIAAVLIWAFLWIVIWNVVTVFVESTLFRQVKGFFNER